MSLTDQQRRVLDAIQGRLRRLGYPPTTRELAQYLGVAIGTVQAHLKALERKGALKRRPFQVRGLYLTAPEDGLGARPSGTSPFWGLQEALPRRCSCSSRSRYFRRRRRLASYARRCAQVMVAMGSSCRLRWGVGGGDHGPKFTSFQELS